MAVTIPLALGGCKSYNTMARERKGRERGKRSGGQLEFNARLVAEIAAIAESHRGTCQRIKSSVPLGAWLLDALVVITSIHASQLRRQISDHKAGKHAVRTVHFDLPRGPIFGPDMPSAQSLLADLSHLFAVVLDYLVSHARCLFGQPYVGLAKPEVTAVRPKVYDQLLQPILEGYQDLVDLATGSIGGQVRPMLWKGGYEIVELLGGRWGLLGIGHGCPGL